MEQRCSSIEEVTELELLTNKLKLRVSHAQDHWHIRSENQEWTFCKKCNIVLSENRLWLTSYRGKRPEMSNLLMSQKTKYPMTFAV